MCKKVDILLATYNGERYVKAQIMSIIGQQYENWRLIVHDDGSTDSTLKIIHECMLIDERILLIDDGVVCHDPARNFLHLLNYSDSEYVMFCDQDDIWFDNKISSMLEQINDCNNSTPILVFCQAYVWFPDESKSIVGKTIHTCPVNLRKFIFSNAGCIGCSSLFNARMRELLKLWKAKCSMHDYILQLIAVAIGRVIYLDKPLMLYRQHKTSVTPNFAVNRYSIDRIFNRKNPVLRKDVYEDVQYFSKIYFEYLSGEDRDILGIFQRLPYCNKVMQILYVIKNGFVIRNSSFALILKILFRKFVL